MRPTSGLCRRRRDYSANFDVWVFRRNWQRQKEKIKDELHAGSFRFSLDTHADYDLRIVQL